MSVAPVNTPTIDLCQPPDPVHRTPKLQVPPGATDCHVHVYGPESTYPNAPTRAFDVPDAPPARLKDLLHTLGIQRAVLVQPSGYGVDNRRHLDGARELGIPTRVIAALRADVSDAELKRLHEQGVRGVRYTIGHKGIAPLSEMPVLAPRIAELGWHVQLHVMHDEGRQPLVEMEQTLHKLPTPVVLDHIGSLRPQEGLDQPGLRAMVRLLDTGRCWIKLSAGYRVSALPPPFEDMVPLVQRLCEVQPERLVWASDWPHVMFKGRMPNTTDLLDQMATWVPDERLRHRILVDNPAVLYGF